MKKSGDYMAAELLVRWLGLSCNSLGARQLILALVLIHRDGDAERPDSLIQNVSTRLYPLVAEHYPSATGAGVERNLRAVRTRLMERGCRDRLEQVMGNHLYNR